MNAKRITHRNGRMTGREVIRQASERALAEDSPVVYHVSYLARRAQTSPKSLMRKIRWMDARGMVSAYAAGRCVIFAN